MVRNPASSLLVVALLATAGCLGTPVGPAGEDASPRGSTPADPPADPSTVTGSPSTGATPGFETVSFDGGPKAEPPRPAVLNESSVASYVRTYEYRYVYNALWLGEHSEVDLDCETESVEAVDGGYRAVVTCTGYSNTGGEASGTATATVVHADWFTQTFVYRVTADETLRRRATAADR